MQKRNLGKLLVVGLARALGKHRRRLRLAPVLIAVLLGAAPAQASVIVTAIQSGGDVILSGSGSLNLTAWAVGPITGSSGGGLQPSGTNAGVGVGDPDATLDIYLTPAGFGGPSSFGPGSALEIQTSWSGDPFGLNFDAHWLGVPVGYTSGAFLSGTATFAGETFASIGMTPGTYVWSWGSGSSADSFTLEIVPEPSTLLLFFGAGLAAAAKRRTNRVG